MNCLTLNEMNRKSRYYLLCGLQYSCEIRINIRKEQNYCTNDIILRNYSRTQLYRYIKMTYFLFSIFIQRPMLDSFFKSRIKLYLLASLKININVCDYRWKSKMYLNTELIHRDTHGVFITITCSTTNILKSNCCRFNTGISLYNSVHKWSFLSL